MLRLTDVVHVPSVAAQLAAWLAPKDAVSLVVWAVERGFHSVACQWMALWTGTSETQVCEVLWGLLVRCAAATGCRMALTRLRLCGSIENYIAMKVPAPTERAVDGRLPASVVYEAAKRGDQSTLQWLCPLASFNVHLAMAYAAANGYLEVAQWIGTTTNELEIRQVEMGGTVMALAWTARDGEGLCRNYFATASYGLAPVQHAGDIGYVGAMDVVAKEGDVILLSAMHKDSAHNWSCTPSAMDAAASRGHLSVLEWLLEHRSEGCTHAAVDGAARHGHLRVIQWLLDHQSLGIRIAASTLLAALEGGQLEVLTWMHNHIPDLWSSSPLLARYRIVEAACVSSNRLRVLQWLDDTKGIRFATQATMSFVLSQGDVETAQWLADPTGDGALLAHWDWVVAKWMSYEFALWHSSTFAKAAENGHLHIVEWLAQAGPFHKVDADTLWRCATRGHLDVVAFVLQRPQHLAKDLVFLPAEWSSFHEAVKDDAGSGHHITCEWDRMACDPLWARRYVGLWLLYRPEACKRVPWLAVWARHCGHEELVQQLNGG